MVAKVRGRFTKWAGQVSLDEADLTKSSVSASIDVSSIDTGVADRDGHLKSPDFFDVQNHPSMTFTSKRVQKNSDTSYTVFGDLAIRGTTKEVPLNVELGGRGKDPWGNQRIGFSATASIDRKDFGLTWNQALETGGILVGDKVNIEIELQAISG